MEIVIILLIVIIGGMFLIRWVNGHLEDMSNRRAAVKWSKKQARFSPTDHHKARVEHHIRQNIHATWSKPIKKEQKRGRKAQQVMLKAPVGSRKSLLAVKKYNDIERNLRFMWGARQQEERMFRHQAKPVKGIPKKGTHGVRRSGHERGMKY